MKVYKAQPSTQVFSSHSLDLARNVVTSPNKSPGERYAIRWRHEISHQDESARRERLGTRLFKAFSLPSCKLLLVPILPVLSSSCPDCLSSWLQLDKRMQHHPTLLSTTLLCSVERGHLTNSSLVTALLIKRTETKKNQKTYIFALVFDGFQWHCQAEVWDDTFSVFSY